MVICFIPPPPLPKTLFTVKGNFKLSDFVCLDNLFFLADAKRRKELLFLFLLLDSLSSRRQLFC